MGRSRLRKRWEGRAPGPGSPTSPWVDSFDHPIAICRLLRGSKRNRFMFGDAIQISIVEEKGPQTNSFLAPIKVRSRSARRFASNGFLNVSLMLERSKLIGLPSSGNKAIRIVSEKS